MREAQPRVALRVDHAVRAHACQDLAVQVVARLREHLRHAHPLQEQRRQDAGLDVLGDRHHAGVEILKPQLLQRLLVDGVGLDDVREPVRHLLHHAQFGVDAEHVVPCLHELLRHRGPEPSEADDGDLLLLHPCTRFPLIRC